MRHPHEPAGKPIRAPCRSGVYGGSQTFVAATFFGPTPIKPHDFVSTRADPSLGRSPRSHPGRARSAKIRVLPGAASLSDAGPDPRSEERRVGKEGGSTCIYRWGPH